MSPSELMIMMGSKPKSKVYRANGKKDAVQNKRNRFEKTWAIRHHKCTSIQDLHGIIQSYKDQPNAVVMRAGLTKDAAARVKKGERIERSKETTLRDVSRSFVMFDIDELERKVEMSLEDEISVARSILPAEFQRASCIVHFSSSARMGNTPYIKIHLFFMLKRAIKTSEFETWIKNWINKIDPSDKKVDEKLKARGIDKQTLSAFQYLSIGNPVLPDTFEDPIGDKRVLLIKGKHDQVEVPSKSSLLSSTAPKVSTYKRHNFTGGDEWANDLFNDKLSLISSAPKGSRSSTLFKHSILAFRLMLAGRLQEQDVYNSLIDSARANGLINTDGITSVNREIENARKIAVSKGPLHPKDYSSRQNKTKLPLKRRKEERLTDYIPSTTEEIRRESRRVVDEAFNLSTSRHHLISVQIPTGAGKTHTSILRAIEEYRRGQTVFFYIRNHDLLGEVRDKFKELDSSIEPKVIKGKLRRCTKWLNGDDFEKEVIKQGLLESKDYFCNQIRCPFKDACENYKEATPNLEGEIVLLPHALLGLYKPPEDAIILIDEMFDPVSRNTAKLDQIQTVAIKQEDEKEYTASQSWRLKHKDSISLFASSISNRIKSWVSSLDQKRKVSTILKGDELLELLEGLEPIARRTLKAIEETTPPRSEGSLKKLVNEMKNLIEGQSMDFIDREGYIMVKSIAQFILGSDEAARDLCIVSSSGKTVFETRSPIKLPKAKIILLDATAEQHDEILKAVAKSNEIPLYTVKADIKPQISQGLFVETQSFKSTQLYKRNGNRVEWRERLKGSLNHVEYGVRSFLRDVPQEGKIGLGTHKALADLLRDARNNEGRLKDHPLNGIIQSYNACEIGHTGKDEVASNKFNDVDAMILLGSPRQNLGSFESDCRALSLSEEETQAAYTKDTEASMIQWIGRARHIRRPNIKFVVFADTFPNVEGIAWTKEKSKGRAVSTKIALIKEDVISDLQYGEILSSSEIANRYMVSESSARDIFNDLEDKYFLHIVEKRSEKGQLQRCLSVLDKTSLIAYLYNIENDADKPEDQKSICTVFSKNGERHVITHRFKGINFKKVKENRGEMISAVINLILIEDERDPNGGKLIVKKRDTPLSKLALIKKRTREKTVTQTRIHVDSLQWAAI